MADRPSEDEYLLAVARVVATRSTCSRLQVGAVLARDGRILSTGRNGAPAGLPHCSHDDDQPCEQSVHAEVNVIAFAARHGVSTLGAHMFLTHSPCYQCAGVLINAGVAAVTYETPYRNPYGLGRLVQAGVAVELGRTA